MFGPEGFGGISGKDGEVTGLGGATVATIARWQIRRSGSNPDGSPKLRFRAWFSWRNQVLMDMCQKGVMKGRVRLYMLSSKGKEQIDLVQWDQWFLNDDGMLTLENVTAFDTSPMRP
jgi:hypothetical protein